MTWSCATSSSNSTCRSPARAVPFSAFAHLRIRGAILNGLEGLSEHYQQLDLHKRLRQERLESLTRNESAAAAHRRDSFTVLSDMAIGLALSQLLEGSGMVQGDEEARGAASLSRRAVCCRSDPRGRLGKVRGKA